MRWLPGLIFTVSSILLAVAGIPLYMKRVPPNGLYGFRIAKTLDNPEVWYAANAVLGRNLMAAGSILAVVSAVVWLGGRPRGITPLVHVNTVAQLVVLGTALVQAYLAAKRM